jgi:hypothetical protein
MVIVNDDRHHKSEFADAVGDLVDLLRVLSGIAGVHDKFLNIPVLDLKVDQASVGGGPTGVGRRLVSWVFHCNSIDTVETCRSSSRSMLAIFVNSVGGDRCRAARRRNRESLTSAR